jgi:hypothetical protein
MKLRIREMLLTPEDKHDLTWLKTSLKTAIAVEFSTIPLYLTARWSIDASEGGDPDTVAETIKDIVLEEMLHMAFVCNMLVGLGETPVINKAGLVPTYPGNLPGDILPGLTVALRRLTPAMLDIFMGVENPNHQPIAQRHRNNAPLNTIGEFYEAIEHAFARLGPAFTTERQIEEPRLGLFKIASLDDAGRAIRLIQHQGEGFRHSPAADTSASRCAHYYRFAEIHHGARLRKNAATGEWAYDGDQVRFPKVRPMADIPLGGYRQEDVAPAVWADLRQFDDDFTTLLNCLQQAWETGNPAALKAAQANMQKLETTAIRLMSTPIPGGTGVYGPCFRLLG